jgi:hypothetical protein
MYNSYSTSHTLPQAQAEHNPPTKIASCLLDVYFFWRMSDRADGHHPPAPDPQSFEISHWFASVVQRLGHIQRRNSLLGLWIQFRGGVRRLSQAQNCQTLRNGFNRKRFAREAREWWQNLAKQLPRTLVGRKLRAEAHRLQTKKNSRHEIEQAKSAAPAKPAPLFLKPSMEEDLSDDREDLGDPLRVKWISLCHRFVNQTKFLRMPEMMEDLRRQRRADRRRFMEQWHALASALLRSREAEDLEAAAETLREARRNWERLASAAALESRLPVLHETFSQWNSRTFKTDTEIRGFFLRGSWLLLRNARRREGLRRSMAQQTIDRFFGCIMITRRARYVAQEYHLSAIPLVRSIIGAEVRNSAGRIKGAVRQHLRNAAWSFGAEFGECIAEACAIVASHHVRPADEPPVRPPPRKVKPNKDPIIHRSFMRPDYQVVDIEDDIESIGLGANVPRSVKHGVEILIRSERSRSDSEASEPMDVVLTRSEVRPEKAPRLELEAPAVIPEGIHQTPPRRPKQKPPVEKPLKRNIPVSEILQLFGVDLEDLNSEEDSSAPDFRFDENPSVPRNSGSSAARDEDEKAAPAFAFGEEAAAGSASAKSSQDSSECPFRFESAPGDEEEEEEEEEHEASLPNLPNDDPSD